MSNAENMRKWAELCPRSEGNATDPTHRAVDRNPTIRLKLLAGLEDPASLERKSLDRNEGITHRPKPDAGAVVIGGVFYLGSNNHFRLLSMENMFRAEERDCFRTVRSIAE